MKMRQARKRKRKKTGISITSIYRAFFLTMTLISVISFVVFWIGDKQTSNAKGWVAHTHETITTAIDFEKQLVDAETGQRGFLLTDSLTYLNPHYTGKLGAVDQFNRLKFLTRDNDNQQQRLETIQVLMQQKLAELQATIDLATNGEKAQALEVVRSHEGQQLMAEIRTILDDFNEEEYRLLEDRQEQLKTTTFTAQIWYVSAFIIVITVLWVGLIRINVGVIMPLAALTKLTHRLGQGERIEFPKHSGVQEIEQLIRSFEYMAGEIESRSAALIDQQEQLQIQVNEQTLKLIQSEKMSSLGQLVAGVAHEINNPVNFIHGNISPLIENTQSLLDLVELYQATYPTASVDIEEKIEDIDLDFLKEDSFKILSSMTVGTKRIRQIVSSLRTFSRLDEADCKEADIHAGIDSTLVILEHRIKATSRRPAIQVIKQYGDLPLVECYPGQLNQVIMNILTNAIDALEERDEHRSTEVMKESPSTIKIQTQWLEPDQVTIRISDNGPGIPESAQQRIFDPFFTTKAVGKGTGIGMSISHQIITEKHGGQIQCLSQPGQGAEFIIQIPLRQKVLAPAQS
jgi:signal transduction histidine kinase